MNLWILTEERPKKEVISQIIGKFAIDKKIYSECTIKLNRAKV